MTDNGSKPQPLFRLEDIVEPPRAPWTYGDTVYEFVSWNMLGLAERWRITKRHERMLALEELATEPTEDDAAEYERVQRELIRLSTPDMTDAVIDTMTREQRREIIIHFLALRLLRTSDSAEKRQRDIANYLGLTLPSTGAPSSSASMPAGRKKSRRG